jgi:hypothetical protein
MISEHYAMTQGQVNTPQAFSVQQIAIFTQQLYCILQRTSTISVTKGVLFLHVTVYGAYSNFKCNFNHKGYYIVTTIRVNHSSNYGNIIRLFSCVESSVSDYKEH